MSCDVNQRPSFTNLKTYLLLLVLAMFASAGVRADLVPQDEGIPAPPFPETSAYGWVNSAPLSWSQLHGKVVLLDFWTFACWNCYRSFPWLNGLEKRLAEKNFQIVGIHSPEFEYEKQLERMKEKVVQYGLKHPIMIDNDHRMWDAIGNRYWPAFYLIDRQGRIRSVYVGEMHADSKQAKALEADLLFLLAEE